MYLALEVHLKVQSLSSSSSSSPSFLVMLMQLLLSLFICRCVNANEVGSQGVVYGVIVNYGNKLMYLNMFVCYIYIIQNYIISQ